MKYLRFLRSPRGVLTLPITLPLMLAVFLLMGVVRLMGVEVYISNGAAHAEQFHFKNPADDMLSFAVPANSTIRVELSEDTWSWTTETDHDGWGWTGWGFTSDRIYYFQSRTRGSYWPWVTSVPAPAPVASGGSLSIEDQLRFFFAGAGFLAPLLVIAAVIRYAKRGAREVA